jgi:hypothetical protein
LRAAVAGADFVLDLLASALVLGADTFRKSWMAAAVMWLAAPSQVSFVRTAILSDPENALPEIPARLVLDSLQDDIDVSRVFQYLSRRASAANRRLPIDSCAFQRCHRVFPPSGRSAAGVKGRNDANNWRSGVCLEKGTLSS